MRRALVAVTALALLGGCSAGTDATGHPAPGSGPEPAPSNVAVAFYTSIHNGKFADACDRMTPESKVLLARNGTPCETALAGVFPDRTQLADAHVDSAWACPNGPDMVSFPGEAVTFAGDTIRSWDSTVMIRRGTTWLIQPDWSGSGPHGVGPIYVPDSGSTIPPRPRC